jgi:hypothetical protein
VSPLDLSLAASSALPSLAASPLAAGAVDLAFRAVLDLVSMTLLTLALFLPRHGRRDLVTVFWMFNAALFCVLLVISGGDIGVGAGLGLFAVLSIVRLRSEQYRNVEIGYFFVSLALALVTGLAPSLLMTAALCAGLLLVVTVVDLGRLFPPARSVEVVLDTVLEDEAELRMELGRRLAGLVVDVSVLQVDYVRMTMSVSVQYRPAPLQRPLGVRA